MLTSVVTALLWWGGEEFNKKRKRDERCDSDSNSVWRCRRGVENEEASFFFQNLFLSFCIMQQQQRLVVCDSICL